MSRGQLRVYLGMAPGVGKTYAMLHEGRRRRDRGTDVVVGLVETHGRQRTAAAIGELAVLPRATLRYRGNTFTELDTDAVLACHPEVALVDELAHTNVPGSSRAKRWQDIEVLLDAGIDVITTVNIQHLESLNDVVQRITGVPQRETVPDEVVRTADQIELVDMSPEALRRRLAHGNVYAPEQVDAALSNYFRPGNLAALRELALLWLADRVDEGLRRYRTEHRIEETWEARERIVVALTGGPEGETVIRRAARIAERTHGAELLAVHVATSDGLTGASPDTLASQRQLVDSLGGSYHQVVGDNVPTALLEFARAENCTQIVLGASRRGPLQRLLTGAGIGATVVRRSGPIDVHLVSHDYAAKGRGLPTMSRGLTPRRRVAGYLLALVGLPALTALLHLLPYALNLTADALLLLLAVVGVALVGGMFPALLAALLGSLLLNYFFVSPLYTFAIAEVNNVLALVVFVTVAAMVSSVVDLAARRTSQAARASAESATLATLAGRVLRGEARLPALLDSLRETFGMSSATLLERTESGQWRQVARSGSPACAKPGDGDIDVPVDDSLMIVLCGRTLPAEDRRVLHAFAAQAGIVLSQSRLAEQAAAAAPLAEADRTRTALLRAVSHDLRTPLASAKAAVSSLRHSEVEWSPADRAELLATADESLDQLARLVTNLLDMSRLQAGALPVVHRSVGLDEVVPLALHGLGPLAAGVRVEVPEDLPPVHADPALLERVVANLLSNALRFSPPGAPPRLTGSALGGRVELRLVDFGPGIAAADLDRVFQPFQRLGDRGTGRGGAGAATGGGVGLGLALARGLVEAMGGTLAPEDTPGGGLTMVVSLPAAGRPTAGPPL